MSNNKTDKLVVFNDEPIRHFYRDEEYLYSVVDVIEALGIENPMKYWEKLKRKFKKDKNALYDQIESIEIKHPDGEIDHIELINQQYIPDLLFLIPSDANNTLRLWLMENIEKEKLNKKVAPVYNRNAELFEVSKSGDEKFDNAIDQIFGFKPPKNKK